VKIAWPDERTRDLATRACMDCHSNDTRWPSYASVAPVSWIVAHDVKEGRAAFDVAHPELSEEAYEAGEVVREGTMPPWYYTPLHRDAVLSAADREALAKGLEQMFGSEAEGAEGGEEAEHDD
jgi:Haem-binding domain